MNKLTLTLFAGTLIIGLTNVASARGRGFRSDHFMDNRFGHHRPYFNHGHFVDRLPRDHFEVVHHGNHFFCHDGVWYRPFGPRFVVIEPPIGVVVPFLPLYYTTIWVNSHPYYYANEAYYAPAEGGYQVVEEPKGETVTAQSSEDRMFVYPRKGQSEKQQADDRYTCHVWAVKQTNYDPTQLPSSSPSPQVGQQRADYNRAWGACLDGKGYTVK